MTDIKDNPPPLPAALIDPEDGENRAVRCFLMFYQGGNAMVADVRENMRQAGFPYWPEWVEQENAGALSKLGAQNWLRHLFALESPAASKPEPQAQLNGPTGVSGTGHAPEPQAQADDPEENLTVAYMAGVERGKEYMREAIAAKDAALQEKALQYVALFGQLQEAREEIAKKDAALDACVEALGKITEEGNLLTPEGVRHIVSAAITKVQECRK